MFLPQTGHFGAIRCPRYVQSYPHRGHIIPIFVTHSNTNLLQNNTCYYTVVLAKRETLRRSIKMGILGNFRVVPG